MWTLGGGKKRASEIENAEWSGQQFACRLKRPGCEITN